MLERLPGWLSWARDTEHARRVGILARTPVFAGGDPGKGLFVVLDGEIEALRDTGQGPQRIVTFGPGTAFGEFALIDDLPRSGSAVATNPTRLLILYRSHF